MNRIYRGLLIAIVATGSMVGCRDGLVEPTEQPDASACEPFVLLVPEPDELATTRGLFANLVVLDLRSQYGDDASSLEHPTVSQTAWDVLDRFPEPAYSALEPHVADIVAEIASTPAE